jgi:Ca2+-binding RTX toxin-like protein
MSEQTHMESLEPRQHLTAVLQANGLLSVVGTHKADNIRIFVNQRTPGDITVTINGLSARFPKGEVTTISVQAGQGNDFVVIERGDNTFMQSTTIFGSGGNDSIYGGYGSDRIYGGDGNDFINGGGNRDIIYGEAGNDTIDGDLGNDFLDGGDDNDSIIGGFGIDYLYGQDGNDTLQGQDSASDRLDGGPNTDTATGDLNADNFVSIENPTKLTSF